MRRVRLDEEPGVLGDLPEDLVPGAKVRGSPEEPRVPIDAVVEIGYRDTGVEVADRAHRRISITPRDQPPRRRARLGCGAGRGRARRSGGASRVDVFGVPRADGQRTAAPAVGGGRRCRSCAGRRAPRCARSARGVAARQRVVAGGQRAAGAGRMQIGRAPRWVGRRAVIAGRAPLAGVRCETDGAQLVPSAQRQHRGRIPSTWTSPKRRARRSASS